MIVVEGGEPVCSVICSDTRRLQILLHHGFEEVAVHVAFVEVITDEAATTDDPPQVENYAVVAFRMSKDIRRFLLARPAPDDVVLRIEVERHWVRLLVGVPHAIHPLVVFVERCSAVSNSEDDVMGAVVSDAAPLRNSDLVTRCPGDTGDGPSTDTDWCSER